MKQILRPFYDYFEKMAKSPYAFIALAILAFTEAIIFPIPNEILFIPLCLFLPKKIWKSAFIVSFFSVLGGVAGYLIGYACFDTLGQSIVSSLNMEHQLVNFSALYEKYGYWVVFVGGFTPIPFKVITLFSGFIKSNFIIFLLASIVSRFARFFIIAFLLKRYGEQARHFIKKRMDMIFLVLCALLLILIIFMG